MEGRDPAEAATLRASLEALASDLRREAEIYRTIARETRRQFEALRRGDAEGLMAIARRKQEELDRVGEIERRIEPVKRTWVERRDEIPAELRELVEAALGEVEESLGELIALEEEASAAIATARDEAGGAIQRICAGRRLRAAYGQPPAGASPRVLDRRE